MASYIAAVAGIGSVGSSAMFVLSFVPFSSPFVMLSRIMVGRVAPWEVALSVTILVASSLLILRLASRIYATGVILYGQRPGVRDFVRAARARRSTRSAPGGSVAGIERQALDQGQDRDRPGRRVGVLAVVGRSSVRLPPPSVDGDEPPQPAADAGQVRAPPVAADDAGMPWRCAAAWSVRPSPGIAGTTSTEPPGSTDPLGVARDAARAARR